MLTQPEGISVQCEKCEPLSVKCGCRDLDGKYNLYAALKAISNTLCRHVARTTNCWKLQCHELVVNWQSCVGYDFTAWWHNRIINEPEKRHNMLVTICKLTQHWCETGTFLRIRWNRRYSMWQASACQYVVFITAHANYVSSWFNQRKAESALLHTKAVQAFWMIWRLEQYMHLTSCAHWMVLLVIQWCNKL